MNPYRPQGDVENLELILSWLGMSQYLDRLREAGFDSWETLMWITEQDLESLDIQPGHRRKLQKEIANSQRLAQRPASGQPLYGLAPLQQLPGDPSPPEIADDRPKKRGYRHHPKPDPNAPPRPYSAYVLFSNNIRDELKAQNLSFSHLSKHVGEKWQAISEEEREGWKQQGAGPWEKYKAEVAEYRKTEQYREYQNYVAQFKADQEARKPSQRQAGTRRSQPKVETPASGPSGASTSPSQQRRSFSSSSYPVGSVGSGARNPMKRPREDTGSGARGGATRAKRACEGCRRRKIRCDGSRPTCRQCKTSVTECRYGESDSDSSSTVDDLWQKVKAYEALLLQFDPKVDRDDQQAIRDAISLPPQLETSRQADKPVTSETDAESSEDGGDDESNVTGVGSMGSTDRVNEHQFLPEGESTAFEGQASDTKWLSRVRTELDEDSGGQGTIPSNFKSAIPLGVAATGARRLQMNTEDADMSVVGNQIYPLEMPIRATADSFVEAYFTTVHPSFPVLDQAEFMSKYEEVISSPDLAVYRDRTFIASLQLVFGIGAVHAHLVNAEWAGDDRDHVLYIACARMLAVDSGVLNDLCYLDQVRVFALGALYLLATDQINRCWNLTGLAIRSAQAMGLHLHNVTPSLTDLEKDQRARAWYGITCLESTLTLMTGRPSMIVARDCSVSLNQVLEEEESSSTEESSPSSAINLGQRESRSSSSREQSQRGSPTTASIYFKHYTELCILAKDVVAELYGPAIRARKWSEIQELIERYDKRLLSWKDHLNPPFDATSLSSDPETESCGIALRILFYSTRIIIHRPSVCRIDERIPHQTSSSKRTNRVLANNCVDAARAVLNLVLNNPPQAILRRGVTWWMVVHHLKRAVIVILLELAYRATHMPAEAGELLNEAKAALNWLRSLGASSPTALESWLSLSKMLFQAARRVGGDTSDIVTSMPADDLNAAAAAAAAAAFEGAQQQQQQQSSGMDFSGAGAMEGQQPSGAYDPNDPNVFPPLGLYGNFAQGDWDEFGFAGLGAGNTGAGAGDGGGGYPFEMEEDREMG